eukprot:912226-Amphidinium_carterae.1
MQLAFTYNANLDSIMHAALQAGLIAQAMHITNNASNSGHTLVSLLNMCGCSSTTAWVSLLQSSCCCNFCGA